MSLMLHSRLQMAGSQHDTTVWAHAMHQTQQFSNLFTPLVYFRYKAQKRVESIGSKVYSDQLYR